MSQPSAGAYVAGLGMVASLGADVLTNCAAARAGISRARPLDHYRLRSMLESAPEPVVGHEAALLTHGFERTPRLVRLAQGALSDLVAQTPDVDWSGRVHRFYLSLPDPLRIHSGAELIADEDERRARLQTLSKVQTYVQAQHEQLGEPDETTQKTGRGAALLRQAAALARWPADVAVGYASDAGHAGGLAAVRAALADLAADPGIIAIVLGVDSLLDEETLEWLNFCGRLKCDSFPAGLQPGEAAVAVALTAEPREVSARRSSVVLRGVSVAREKRGLLTGAVGCGEGLADVIAQAWGAEATTPWIISDHNGEIYRATDWGHAVVRLRALSDAFADPVVWYPSMSFGDTAAASALVGIAVAVRAWERRYAPGPTALVVSASDGEGRAALPLVSMVDS